MKHPPVEFEYSDKNRHRSRLYIGVGLIVALVAAASVYVAIRRLRSSTRRAPRSAGVVAVRNIPSRKPIEEGDVAVRSVVADATNESAFSRIDEVLNHVSGVSIAAGQLITPNELASATEGQAFSILEPGASSIRRDRTGARWR